MDSDSLFPHMHSKAQAAVELLAYWSFFFLAFVTMLAYLTTISQAELHQKQYEQAAEYAHEIGGYFDFAVRAGSGFAGTFPLRSDIMGRPYYATFSSSGNLYVEWEAQTAQKVDLDTQAGFVRFTNKNGTISISQAAMPQQNQQLNQAG
ncbi:hypothetical protein J4441_05480 [Candidatus Micrarchaeota archaeon]|nr:hypothetical protein [Candidatus Micrarchaeota archaeon]